MHNLTPHLHGDHQVTETSMSDNDDEDGGLLDWMQRMFVQDLGEGHLEHCVTADNDNYNDLSWDVCPPSIWISSIKGPNTTFVTTRIKVKPPLIKDPISRIHFIHLPLRAPPVAV